VPAGPVALAAFVVSAALALYILWKILRTPGASSDVPIERGS
jgi:hypothetical protein